MHTTHDKNLDRIRRAGRTTMLAIGMTVASIVGATTAHAEAPTTSTPASSDGATEVGPTVTWFGPGEAHLNGDPADVVGLAQATRTAGATNWVVAAGPGYDPPYQHYTLQESVEIGPLTFAVYPDGTLARIEGTAVFAETKWKGDPWNPYIYERVEFPAYSISGRINWNAGTLTLQVTGAGGRGATVVLRTP